MVDRPFDRNQLRNYGTHTVVAQFAQDPDDPFENRQLNVSVVGSTTLSFADYDTQKGKVLREVVVPVEVLFEVYPLIEEVLLKFLGREVRKEAGGGKRSPVNEGKEP